VECVPRVIVGRSGMDVHVRLNTPTLAFLKVDGGFEARVLFQVRLMDPDELSQVAEAAWPETVRVATYAETQSHPPLRIRRFVPAAAGTYKVQVQLEDLGSGKTADRMPSVTIPRVTEGEPSLGGIVLSRRVNGGEPDPVVEFHVPAPRDTLFARAPALNVPAGTPLQIEFAVCRYVTDTARAPAPYLHMPTMPAMERKRVFPQAIDTILIMHETRNLGDDGYILDDILPPLGRGVYQLSLYVWGPGQERTQESAAGAIKYFAVVGPAFPRPVLISDLIDACGYIAYRPEQAAMDTLTVQSEMRVAFDRFWLSAIRDRSRATRAMRAYFSRIEEANRLFSSYKEGWKTDRGMVFAVFGPPENVEKKAETETWYYNLPGSYQSNVFEFRRVFFAPASLAIEDYVLRRSMIYETSWERMVEKWREGEVF
jgi:GWxTD domain-containing protein